MHCKSEMGRFGLLWPRQWSWLVSSQTIHLFYSFHNRGHSAFVEHQKANSATVVRAPTFPDLITVAIAAILRAICPNHPTTSSPGKRRLTGHRVYQATTGATLTTRHISGCATQTRNGSSRLSAVMPTESAGTFSISPTPLNHSERRFQFFFGLTSPQLQRLQPPRNRPQVRLSQHCTRLARISQRRLEYAYDFAQGNS